MWASASQPGFACSSANATDDSINVLTDESLDDDGAVRKISSYAGKL